MSSATMAIDMTKDTPRTHDLVEGIEDLLAEAGEDEREAGAA